MPTEERRTVTILFSDLAGFTRMGEQLDPESLRRLMTRYFQEVKSVIERHGGMVEKFIGDAVMGVFGMPRLHEDDALRAVRAAVEISEVLKGLNDEFERAWRVRISVRTGVNTGEVVAGDSSIGQGFIAGDAVNVAARLEQAAGPGEILIGETTHRLVRDAALAEALPPLPLKGKAEPVAAWKLLEVRPGVPGWARRLDSPLVGRDEEQRLLQELFERCVEQRGCRLVTVMGAAGVGKSRLTNEFLSGLQDAAQVLNGRCLPYGEGITFWPLSEVLTNAAGISDMDSPEEARPKISRLIERGEDANLVGERLAALLGLSDVTPAIQETFWAVRKLFEYLATERPLVVVFDDIHWAEAIFLDLLEYLVDLVRNVPLLLVCLARPELLEIRPGWMTGKRNASLIELSSLSKPETEGLIRNLLNGTELTADTKARITDVTEGNPLFVEEILRMLVDDGVLGRTDGSWTVTGDISDLTIPPTIQALLSARLDRLDREERAVIERASVIGRMFWWGAVSELSPEEDRSRVGSHLQALNRKELIRPDYSDLREEDAFRFTHILIRDAAYSAIPKTTRAELHERVADWIEAKVRDRAGEYEEILGYHLEQAYRALLELGPRTERAEALGRRAAVQLASAGRRSFARGDMPAAVNLLSRAASLLTSDDPSRLAILPDLAFALLETGDFARLQEVVGEASEAAKRSGERLLEAHALQLDLWMRLFTQPEGWGEEARPAALRSISMFEEQGDEQGVARGWSLLGLVHLLTCQFASSEDAWERAAVHARAAGRQREELEYMSWVPLVVWGGPRPVDDGIRRCREVFERTQGDRKTMSTSLFVQAKFEAMRGRFDVARALISQARAHLEEVSIAVWTAGPFTQFAGWVELLAGDAQAADRVLRSGAATLREIGELSWLSTVAAILAEALYRQGRLDEVEEFIQLSRETAGSEDAYSQCLLRCVWSKQRARRGEEVAGERLAREAVSIVEPTDFRFAQAFALLSLGEVLLLSGRRSDGERVLANAIQVCEGKGFSVGVEWVRELLNAGDQAGATS